MYNNDIFQCGGCEITRIRHAVSIIFTIQLRMRPWVDSEYKSITLCYLFLEMEWGGLFMIK